MYPIVNNRRRRLGGTVMGNGEISVTAAEESGKTMMAIGKAVRSGKFGKNRDHDTVFKRQVSGRCGGSCEAGTGNPVVPF